MARVPGYSGLQAIALLPWEPPLPAQSYPPKLLVKGSPGGPAVEHLPWAQGVTPGPRIESHVGLPAWSLLLLCFSLSFINK